MLQSTFFFKHYTIFIILRQIFHIDLPNIRSSGPGVRSRGPGPTFLKSIDIPHISVYNRSIKNNTHAWSKDQAGRIMK